MIVENNNNKNYFLLLFLIAIPFIIYFYFLKWKTGTIYGDDLFMFKQYSSLDGFFQKINLPTSFGKFRPMHGLSLYLIIEWFQKNLDGYYLFNIGIQSIITIIFAQVLNIFLKSPIYSLLFSLMLGLSRFSFFNISQLLNGGALEGIAMAFFLLSLFFIIKVLAKNELATSQKQRGILLSILFANLSMYTHERYIVLLPFIFLVIIMFPSLKAFTWKQKINLNLLALGSIALNVAIKKLVYSMPFFVGTAGTTMSFSFSSAASFFVDAVLSIFQINSGPEYLVGLTFSSLPIYNKLIVMVSVAGLLLLLTRYLMKAGKAFISRQEESKSNFFIFIFLTLLIGLFLIPAIVTIRLEQRWLQAPLSIFILLIIIALSSLNFKTSYVRNWLPILFVTIFLWTDFNYLNKGAANLYMSDSEELASDFKQAIDKGVIPPNTAKLYIWESKKDENTENAIKWSLGDGYFFEFYQDNSKKIVFVDSIYQKSYSFPVSSFVNFNPSNERILFLQNNVIDITRYYLEDSLKSFKSNVVNKLTSTNIIQYDQKHLQITNDDFNKFITQGFHANENGIRWTTGNASIVFSGDFIATDTINLELNTYLPPICQNINPKISIIDAQNKIYQPFYTKRQGDKFYYKFGFKNGTYLQKIQILSDTIDGGADLRELSFPFISIALNQ